MSGEIGPGATGLVPEPAPAEQTPAARGLRWWLGRLGRPLIGLLLVAAIGWAVAGQWPDVSATLATISTPNLVAALALAVVGMICNVMAWNAVLRTLGTRVRPVEACRCFLVGQIGKYLPGSVWAFVLQIELAKRAGVPRVNGFTATIVTLGLSIATALTIGLAGLPELLDVGGAAAWVIPALLPVALVCSLPPVLTRLVNLLLKLMRRRSLPHGLGWADVGRVLGWTSLAWVLFGTHLWLLAGSVTGQDAAGWLQSLGVFALAMTAGSLALVAPSGIGVREAIVVAALAPHVPVGVALGVAVASRLVFVAADLLAAAASAGLATLADRRAATPSVTAA